MDSCCRELEKRWQDWKNYTLSFSLNVPGITTGRRNGSSIRCGGSKANPTQNGASRTVEMAVDAKAFPRDCR